MASLRDKMESSYAAVAFAERNQGTEAVLLMKGNQARPEKEKRAAAPGREEGRSRPVQRAE